jgi:hypothetical protein
VASGAVCWKLSLPFLPSWISSQSDAILTAGDGGIARLSLSDGRLEWSFAAASPLAAFRVAGPRVFFLEGGQQLIALDSNTGETLWTRWAPAAGLGMPPPSGRFNPLFSASSERLLVQTGGGRRLLLDAATGRTVQETEGNHPPWPQPPLAAQNGNVREDSFFVATRPDRIVMLDARTGQEVWRYDLPYRGTLTGELPQIVADAQSIFVLVPRNYGSSLQRLDGAKGTALWPEERLLSNEMLAVDQVACDDRAVYFVAGNVIHARDLSDGRALWSLPLRGPGGRWRVASAAGLLVASPASLTATLHRNDGPIEWSPVTQSLPRPVARSERPTLPLALIDPRTGQLMQRLNFPLASSAATTRKLLQPERGADCLLSRNGVVIGLAGKASRFAVLPAGGD